MRRITGSRPGLLVLVVAAGVLLTAVPADHRLAAQDKDQDFNPQRVLAPIAPITSFQKRTVREAGTALNPSELVIGVTVGKESRAYPINMLTGPQREILNDKLGGKAIAATW